MKQFPTSTGNLEQMSHCGSFQPYQSCDLQNNFNYAQGLFDTHNEEQILQINSSTHYSSSSAGYLWINFLPISYILCLGIFYSLEKICKQKQWLCERMNIKLFCEVYSHICFS